MDNLENDGLRLEWLDPAQLAENPRNWRRHPKRQREALQDVLDRVGWAGVLLYNEATGHLIDGHLRREVALESGEPVPVLIGSWTDEQERVILATLDPIAAMAEAQSEALAELLADIEKAEPELEELLRSVADEVAVPLEHNDEVGTGDIDERYSDDRWALYAPDAVFPSDNEWDVPTLLPEYQADFLELPLTKWGDKSRRAKMSGTYHFYTEDYKFEALWRDPTVLINSGCVAIVEPNISTNEAMPRAVVLWGIYRKRWLARYVQEYGIKVWVDMNVEPRFSEMNLIGVPRGWRSYSTRGLDRRLDDLVPEYERACEWASPNPPRFLVYGGGKSVEAFCKERGWFWLPENQHVKEGRVEAAYG